MATPSTSKKIQRVQQSGVTRRVGQRRPVGFPAGVALIIVVGLVLVWFARDARINVNGDQPRANLDAWHEAFGVYQCDDYLPNLAAAEDSDITTLGNGLINVSPLSDDTAGDNATIDKFFDTAKLEVTDTSVKLPDGTELKAGDECGAGKKKTTKTVLKLFVWPPQASDKTKPEVLTDDFGSLRFDQDQGIYALALVPESTDQIDLPPSVSNLADPEGSVPATTVAPSDTTTTVPGAETTAPAAETTAPAAETTVAPTTAAPTTTKG